VPGKCRVHIVERAEDESVPPVAFDVDVFDGSNTRLGGQSVGFIPLLQQSVTVQQLALGYDFQLSHADYYFGDKASDEVAGETRDWALTFQAGSTKWTTMFTDKNKLPYCSIGGWDESFMQKIGGGGSTVSLRIMPFSNTTSLLTAL
jgi:hypothetical protein